jgi:hypothetical protein
MFDGLEKPVANLRERDLLARWLVAAMGTLLLACSGMLQYQRMEARIAQLEAAVREMRQIQSGEVNLTPVSLVRQR